MSELKEPAWVCFSCAKDRGAIMPEHHVCTTHIDICGICGCEVEVTEPRDFGRTRYLLKIKIMNLQTYQKEANRTLKMLGDHRLDLAHMLMGLSSEHNELQDAIDKEDDHNVSEELADHCWYAGNYATLQGYVLGEDVIMMTDSYFTYGFDDLVKAVSKLTDLVKKNVVYNKPIDPLKEKSCLQRIFDVCYNFTYSKSGVGNLRVDLPRALQNNIDKLRARFPEKYTDDLAQNRDLVKERQEIEK